MTHAKQPSRPPIPRTGPDLGDPRPRHRRWPRSATRSSASRPRSRAGKSSASTASATSPGDSSAACRRKATGRLRRRAGLDPGLHRPAVRSCREDFLATIPGLVDDYARPGDVKLLDAPLLGRAEPARARLLRRRGGRRPGLRLAVHLPLLPQPGRGRTVRRSTRSSWTRWPARSSELNVPEWEQYLEDNGGSDGADRAEARGLRRARHRARHPHRPGGDRHRPRRDPRPCRTAPRWPRSKPRSKPSSSCGPRLG